MAGPEPSSPRDITEYVAVLRRRRWVFLLVFVLVAGAIVGQSARRPDRYRAAADVLLRGSAAETLAGVSQVPSGGGTRNAIATEISFMQSRSVADAVTTRLGRVPAVSIGAVGEGDVIRITATNLDPARAAETANVYAATYVELKKQALLAALIEAQESLREQTQKAEGELAALVAAEVDEDDPQRQALANLIGSLRIQSIQLGAGIVTTGGAQVISEAFVPVAPFEPDLKKSGAAGVVVGLLFAIAAAFALDAFDDRIRSKTELEKLTGWSVIGLIPQLASWRNRQEPRVVTLEDPQSESSEAYRALRTSVQFIALERPIGLIQVTSPTAGEGKTTTIANLGVALAQSGLRVIIVDCDLRRPRLHTYFDLANDVGLTSVLIGDAKLFDAVRPSGVPNLAIFCAGSPPPNPSELLALEGTRTLLRSLLAECDVVLVDSPPLLPVADSVILSAAADAVVVVSHTDQARSRVLQRASELLADVNAPVIGSVVNGVDNRSGFGYYAEATYTYATWTAPTPKRRRGLRRSAPELTER